VFHLRPKQCQGMDLLSSLQFIILGRKDEFHPNVRDHLM
jgi:hypothetical protein